MDPSNSSKKSRIKFRYTKEELLSLRTNKACKKWPSGLNKCCLNGKGLWDPFQSYKSNQSLDSNFIKNKDIEKESKSRAPLNERDRDAIVLGPQKRSWDAGCHVIQRKSPNDMIDRSEKPSTRGGSVSSGSETRLPPRRIPDSSGRSAFQEGGKLSRGIGERSRDISGRYDDYNYREREPPNRFYSESGYRGRDRGRIDKDRGEYENSNRGFRRNDSSYDDRDDHRPQRGFIERSYRGERESSRGGKFSKSRHPPRQQTFNIDVEPEWMSGGPSTVNETIELTGIKEKDGMQDFKRMETASSDENPESDEFEKEDVEDCEELHNLREDDCLDDITPSPDFNASSMEESDNSKETHARNDVNQARGSRFRDLFMTTADGSSHDAGSRDRDAQLFDLIKGGSNAKPVSSQSSTTKEMENVLKDILFKKQPESSDSTHGFKNVKPPLNLSSCNVRTVDDIESSMSVGNMGEVPDNKGAGDEDSSVFSRLLGMVQNAAANAAVLSNTQTNSQLTTPSQPALLQQSAANKQSRLPGNVNDIPANASENSMNALRQRQQILNALNGSSSNALTTAALIRQQQLQAGISGDGNQTSTVPSRHAPNPPQQPAQALASHTNTAAPASTINSPAFLGQNNKNARNAEQFYMALRAVNNHSMAMQYDTNAVAASARINQLQNSDQVFNQNNVASLQAGKVNIPTGQSQDKESRTLNYYDNSGIHPNLIESTPSSGPRPLTKMQGHDQPPLDYQHELAQQAGQMSLYDNSPPGDNNQQSRLVRPIVKTMQPSEFMASPATPPNTQNFNLLQRQLMQQRRNQQLSGMNSNQQYSGGFAGNSGAFNMVNSPSSSYHGSSNYQPGAAFKPVNYPGSSFGMNNANQDVNKTLLLQQMLIQRQMEAKSAAIQRQHCQTQQTQQEVSQAPPNISGINSNNNSSNSLHLSQLFNMHMQNKSTSAAKSNMPPLPSRDSNAVKTLEELEG